jgi:hypothetical protein
VTVANELASTSAVRYGRAAGLVDADLANAIARYTEPRRPVLDPTALEEYPLVALPEPVVVNVVHAHDGDFRDWSAIRAWADQIGAALNSAAVPAGDAGTLTDSPSQSLRASAYFG